MKTSVIIPTLNEAENIQQLVHRLLDGGGNYLSEVIVVDCGSSDETQYLAKAAGAKVIVSACKSRAKQMNIGVKTASGKLLYFVHGVVIYLPFELLTLRI